MATVGTRLKRLSMMPTSLTLGQGSASTVQPQPRAVKQIHRQLGRAATLKRFQLSHKLDSEEPNGGVQKLMQPTGPGARFVVGMAQYLLMWFSDPRAERDYAYFAYIPRVKRLA